MGRAPSDIAVQYERGGRSYTLARFDRELQLPQGCLRSDAGIALRPFYLSDQ
jgi:hypothetical protein